MCMYVFLMYSNHSFDPTVIKPGRPREMQCSSLPGRLGLDLKACLGLDGRTRARGSLARNTREMYPDLTLLLTP
jgi:hypothetical protein